LVDRRDGLVPVPAADLKSGDRVVTMESGAARMRYADGCTVSISARTVATVGSASPCAQDAGLVQASNPALMESTAGTLWVLVGLVILA